MKLIAVIKLLPTPAQAVSLRTTMEHFNAACEWLAGEAHAAHMANKFALQKAHYATLRERFGLSSQLAVRCIAKVCEAYTRDLSTRPHFKPMGGVPYDPRIYSLKNDDSLSILTLEGRAVVPFVAGEGHAKRLACKRGQADLIVRGGCFYFYVSVDVPEANPIETTGVLGVDLGIINLATDSDRERYTGGPTQAVRVRLNTLKSELQAAGTPSAKRHLKKLAGREARFHANTNHTIAKKLVAKAKDTGRAIALEDLQGIRSRVTVRRIQRSALHGWSFFQLRAFVAYKAALAGVPVVLVDARNTSRTCLQCDHCEKGNRRSRAEFVCKSCGFAEHADVVGARNVARRAAVNRPIVSSVEAGTEDIHSQPRRAQKQAPAFRPE